MSPVQRREWEEGYAKTFAGLRVSLPEVDRHIEAVVERVLNNLVRWGEVTRSPYTLELWVIYAARQGFQRGRESLMLELRTTAEAAEEIGVHQATIARWAARYELGWRVGHERLFLARDVERMRALRR